MFVLKGQGVRTEPKTLKKCLEVRRGGGGIWMKLIWSRLSFLQGLSLWRTATIVIFPVPGTGADIERLSINVCYITGQGNLCF